MRGILENSTSYFGYGTSQLNRMPRALDPSYVQLDDRGISELLHFTSTLSENINFFNLENKVDGNWSDFFNANITVILATIISYDLVALEKEFNDTVDTFLKNPKEDVKEECFLRIFKMNFEILEKFNHWFENIQNISVANKRFEATIEKEFHNIIKEKVVRVAHSLKAYYLAGEKNKVFSRDPEFDFDSLNPIWQLDTVELDDIYFGKTKSEKISSATLQLRLVFRNLFQSLNYCVFHFEKYFEKSLNVKQDHSPNIALFIAFLKLFKYIQNDYNDISKKLLKFYYEKYLFLNPKPDVADQVFVYFQIASHTDRYFMRKHTLLEAGLDEDGNEIHFETVNDLEMTQAKISALRTLYSSRVDDLDTSNYKLVSNLYSADVANSKDGFGEVQLGQYEEWPLFGEEQEYKPDEQISMKPATIGFAVSSPMFYLNEGRRSIKIKFNFKPESTRIFKRLLLDVREKVNAEKAPEEPNASLEEIFYGRIFNQIDNTRNFKIELTGRKGWFEVTPNTIGLKADGDKDWFYDDTVRIEDTLNILNSLTLSFTLPIAAPSVIGFDQTLHEDQKLSSFHPILKLVLDPKKQPFSYSFLYALEIIDITIDTRVEGVRKLQIFNEEYNQIESRGFYPFGVQPLLGTKMYIGNTEIFKKNLRKVDFHVKWDKMPKKVIDYKEIYSKYKDDFNPAEVLLRFGALNNFEFITDYDESLEFPMFTTTDGDPNVHDQTEIIESKFELNEIAFDNLLLDPDPYIEESNPLNDETRSGYFEVEIIGPELTLGHSVYQQALDDAIARNVENPQAGLDLPQQPVIPYIREISMDYEAQSHFNVAYGDVDKEEELFHIHPFGIEKIYEDGSPTKPYLMPKYVDDGYLFIGLENVNLPESISLLFQLSTKRTKLANINNIPQINWMYLSNNIWKKLDDSHLLFDGTEGFTKSGIIKIQLPMRMTDNNTLLDPNLHWLGVSVEGDTELLCQAIYIKENAVTAQRVLHESSYKQLKMPLKPASITTVANNPSEVVSVHQPFESFNGVPKEEDGDFFCRVCERIRHKNRAVVHWDFERLILEEYRNIKQAKCLSYLSNPLEEKDEIVYERYLNIEEEKEDITGIKHKDGISIVVVPKKKKYFEDKTPKFSLNELLEMKDYISTLVSNFTKVTVVNPLYEYVRVFGNVKFIENHNNGITLNRLINDINEFISPWLFDEQKQIQIGGTLNENVLQNFIKGLSYVKFFTKFSILHIIEENGIFKLQDTATDSSTISIIKARPWGILLPDDTHELRMIEYEEEEEPTEKVNADEVIRFQNKVNILGEKKYIKIKNPLQFKEEESESVDTSINIEFKL